MAKVLDDVMESGGVSTALSFCCNICSRVQNGGFRNEERENRYREISCTVGSEIAQSENDEQWQSSAIEKQARHSTHVTETIRKLR